MTPGTRTEPDLGRAQARARMGVGVREASVGMCHQPNRSKQRLGGATRTESGT